MKKLFLTSGVILCMACPALAGQIDYTAPETPGGQGTYELTNNGGSPTCQYPTLSVYTGPQTFYATWSKHQYRVRYNNQSAGQGSTTAAATTQNLVDNIEFNTSYEIRDNANDSVFTKKGYTFTGWLSDHNLASGASTPVYASGDTPANPTSYTVEWLADTDNNPLTFLVSSAENDTVEMFAQWTPNKYNVVYNYGAHAKAGTSSTLANYTDPKATAGMTFDAAYTALTFTSDEIKANMQAADGYTFCGWSTSSSQTCTDPTAANSWKWTGTTLANDTATDEQLATYDESGYNVYAIYAANHYTLTYNCGQPTVSGSQSVARFKGSLSDATHAFDRVFAQNGYGALFTASDVCELDGYHIDTTNPWTCVVTGSDPAVSVAVANVGDTWNVANNVTCTANWVQNQIGLSWSIGTGSTRGTAGGQACTYDSTISVEGAPTRAGYDFQGWTTNTSNLPEGTEIFSGNTSTPGTSDPAPAQQDNN